jgi:hypothetical protein
VIAIGDAVMTAAGARITVMGTAIIGRSNAGRS